MEIVWYVVYFGGRLLTRGLMYDSSMEKRLANWLFVEGESKFDYSGET